MSKSWLAEVGDKEPVIQSYISITGPQPQRSFIYLRTREKASVVEV
jgi:hypothetical protein